MKPAPRYLAEYSGEQTTGLSAVRMIPSGTEFYDIKGHVVKYPLYYSTFDDPKTLIPFRESIYGLKITTQLFSELDAMINITGYNYLFLKNVFSPISRQTSA